MHHTAIILTASVE